MSTQTVETKERTASTGPRWSLGMGTRAEESGLLLSYGWVALVGILIVAFGLRFYCLDCHSLWYDDVVTIEPAQQSLASIFGERFGWIRVQTPFYYSLVWLLVQWVDPTVSSIAVRLPGALAGALTPLFAYGIGRELFGRAQGLLAALFTALSVVSLDYSEDVRPYALLSFLTAATVYCLLMADRTGSRTWWAAFAATAVLNVVLSYYAANLVMPALAPYLLWVAWRLWKMRRAQRTAFVYGLGAMLAAGLATLIMLLDLLQLRRTPPDLSLLDLQRMVEVTFNLMGWFTQFGLSPALENGIDLFMPLLALVGALAAVWRGQQRGALLCLSLVLVPALLLAVLSTTNTVFERYAIFSTPFFYLLVANALAALVSLATGVSEQALAGKVARGSAAALLGVTVAGFVVGALNFTLLGRRGEMTYGPDFRGASAYLSREAGEGDLIIFADDPALGYTTSSFFWRDRPPAAAYDARDPRLFAERGGGDIYWVISSLNKGFLRAMIEESQGWDEVTPFDNVVVLRAKGPTGAVLDSVERMAARMEAVDSDFAPVLILRGSVYQARGEYGRAAELYREAGKSFLFDTEYLNTARGYAERGDMAKAWRDAAIAKYMGPGNPEVHAWLAEQLEREGYARESRAEAAIAAELLSESRRVLPGPASPSK